MLRKQDALEGLFDRLLTSSPVGLETAVKMYEQF